MLQLLAIIEEPFIAGWDTPNGLGLKPFIGELWIIATIVAVLLTPFFTRRSNVACALVSLAGLAVAFLSVLLVGDSSIVGTHFRGLLVADQFSVLWKLMLLLFVFGIILMWFSTTASSMHEGDGPEFFTLLLGATLGMMLMSSTANLLMLFMAIEMASYPSYVLAGFRKTHRVGAEASLKYVLFGAAASAVMVYGLSLLYGLYGTLQVDEIAHQMTRSSGAASAALLAVAIFGLIVGIGFKVSAVPFHFWCPDVFEGASIEVSAFLSVASKGAALALLLRVMMTFAAALGYQNHPGVSLSAIAWTIGIIGAITCTVGNTAAFVQTHIKRLLAYSSIAHAGYMLCAISLLVRHGAALTDPANQVAQVLLFYLGAYLFMNLGAFTIAGLIYRETGSEDIREYANMGRRQPVLAAAMFCCLVSLIGLPPFAGFMAKWNVLWVLFQNGGWWWILIVVIGINTILSAFYYFRVVRQMYLPLAAAPETTEQTILPNPIGTIIGVGCALILFLMLIAYNPLDRLTHNYGKVYLGAGTGTRSAQTASAQ
jgi:NADH-quinone oxidoreductase subunit N